MKCEEMRTARVEQREEMINFSGTDRAIACFLLGFCYKGVNACKIGETFIICSCIALGLLFFFFCKSADHGSCEGFHFYILDCVHAVFILYFIFL